MKPGKIIGRILLFIFIAGVFAILGRIFMMDDNGSLTKITPTESAKEAFASLGKEAFATHKFRASIAPDGYFSAHSMVYNRSQRELQLTARYNESIYKYMDVADSGLDVHITTAQSEDGKSQVPALTANIPIKSMKKR